VPALLLEILLRRLLPRGADGTGAAGSRASFSDIPQPIPKFTLNSS